jgi:hypothetical protein
MFLSAFIVVWDLCGVVCDKVVNSLWLNHSVNPIKHTVFLPPRNNAE